MKTIIKGSILALTLLSSVSYAEYYFAPPGVVYTGCATGCCGSSCGGERVITRERVYSPPARKVKYYTHNRARGNYSSVSVYYAWPTYAGPVWAPACGGGCAQPMVTYCDSFSCPGFYVPPEYYTSYSNVDMYDERTADDYYW